MIHMHRLAMIQKPYRPCYSIEINGLFSHLRLYVQLDPPMQTYKIKVSTVVLLTGLLRCSSVVVRANSSGSHFSCNRVNSEAQSLKKGTGDV